MQLKNLQQMPCAAFFHKNRLFWLGTALFSCYLSVVLCAIGRSSALFGRLFASGSLGFAAELAKLLAVALLCFAVLFGVALLWARRQQSPLRTTPPLRKRWFFVIFAALLLLWLGFYALEYPGVCIHSDNSFQFEEYFSGHHLNWHPVVHTLLTNFLVFTIGRGSLVPYMLFQMAALAAVVTYSLYWINSRVGARFRLPASLLWFLLHPVFAYMSFTLTKDVLFSAFLLLLTIELAELCSSAKAGRLHLALLAIAALGVLFFRNNGVFIIALLLPCALLLAKGRSKKRLLTSVCALTLVAFFLMQGVLFRALRVEQTPLSEAFAIPLQQFGRVVKEERPLAEDEAAYLDSILPLEQWKTLYSPISIDPVKFAEDFYGGVIAENPKQFARIWLGLLLHYPADFFAATLDETQMLWDPAAKPWMIFSYDSTDEYAFQIQHSPAPALTNAVRSGVYWMENSTVLHLFWNPAFLFMAAAIVGLALLLRRQKERLLPLIPCFVLWLSLALTIPAGLLGRYVFSIFLCIPLFLTLLAREEKSKV
ncbi:MAG: DUF6020 family protein [Oscillospiraceae bacterium]|jgi:hypothetical protein|nr:DUF6020 family protein [Oscillospiraceae bacterium]